MAPNEQQKAEIINKLRIEETRNHLLPLILSLWLLKIKEHFLWVAERAILSGLWAYPVSAFRITTRGVCAAIYVPGMESKSTTYKGSALTPVLSLQSQE